MGYRLKSKYYLHLIFFILVVTYQHDVLGIWDNTSEWSLQYKDFEIVSYMITV